MHWFIKYTGYIKCGLKKRPHRRRIEHKDVTDHMKKKQDIFLNARKHDVLVLPPLPVSQAIK